MVAAAGGTDIWVVSGGDLVGQFDGAGLLDEIWLGMRPVFLGAGAPLLPRRITSSRLTLREARQAGQSIRIVLRRRARRPRAGPPARVRPSASGPRTRNPALPIVGKLRFCRICPIRVVSTIAFVRSSACERMFLSTMDTGSISTRRPGGLVSEVVPPSANFEDFYFMGNHRATRRGSPTSRGPRPGANDLGSP